MTPCGNVLGAGAVVRQEDDQGVVELAGLFQRGDDAADALVHAVDLRGIDLHAAQGPFAVLGFGPRRLGRIAVGQLPVRMDDAVVDQALEPLLAQCVPAGVEPALVFGDVLVMGMQRPVRRGVGDILKERRIGIGLLVLADIGDRLIADRIGIEERRIVLGLVLDIVVAAGQRIRMVEAAGADDGAEEIVEAALQRPGIGRLGQAGRNVPLAAEIGLVVVLLEHLGDGDAALVQIAGIAFRSVAVGEDADPGLMRMQAGQQRGARRAAAGGVVELRIAQAVGRQSIQIGRLDFAAVTADVGKSHVIVEDDQDVGAVGCFTICHGYWSFVQSGGRGRLGMTPRQVDAEAEIVRQIDRAQQFERTLVLAQCQAFHRQQRAADLDAEQLGAGGVGKRRADRLLRFLDVDVRVRPRKRCT